MKIYPTNVKQAVAIVLAILAVCGITISITQGDHSTTVTVTVQTPSGPTAITASTSAVHELATGDHNNLDGTTPTCPAGRSPGAVTPTNETVGTSSDCVTPAQKAAGANYLASVPRTLPLGPLPAAATSMPGCVDRFLKTNYSSRNGIAPKLIVWHLTESPDSGWSGINGNIAWFSSAAAQVSIHFLIDGKNGDCAYTLPMALKAWHVVSYNSLAIGIEKTGTESDGYYVKGKARTRIEVLTARIAHTWHIPVRRGAVGPGCPQVRRSGIVDHYQLGNCGGGHNDINPYRGVIPGLIHGTKVWYGRLYGNHTAARCNELKSLRAKAAHRHHVHRKPYWTAARKARAEKLKHELGSKAASCR
jgi:hypothetical protein